MEKQVEFLFSNNKITGIRVLDKVYEIEELEPTNREKLYQEIKKIAAQEPNLLFWIKNQSQSINKKREEQAQKKEKERKNMEWYQKLESIKKQEQKRNKTLSFKIGYKTSPNQPDEITIIDGDNEIVYKKEDNKSYLEFVEFVADTYPQIKKQINLEALKKENKLSAKIKNLHVFQFGKEFLRSHKKQAAIAGGVAGTIALVAIGYMVGIGKKSNSDQVTTASQFYETNSEDYMSKVDGTVESANEKKDFDITFDESVFETPKKTTIITSDPAESHIIYEEESQSSIENESESSNEESGIFIDSNEPSNPESNHFIDANEPSISEPSTPIEPEITNPETSIPNVPTTPTTPDPGSNNNQENENNSSQPTEEEQYHNQQNYENIYQDVYGYAYSLFVSEFKNSGGMEPEIYKVIDAVHQQYGDFYDNAITEAYQNFKEQYMFSGVSIGKTQ